MEISTNKWEGCLSIIYLFRQKPTTGSTPTKRNHLLRNSIWCLGGWHFCNTCDHSVKNSHSFFLSLEKMDRRFRTWQPSLNHGFNHSPTMYPGSTTRRCESWRTRIVVDASKASGKVSFLERDAKSPQCSGSIHLGNQTTCHVNKWWCYDSSCLTPNWRNDLCEGGFERWV